LRRSAVALLLAGCAQAAPREPSACTSRTVPGVTAGALSVADTPVGATAVWVAPEGVTSVNLPDGAPELVAPGSYDSATAVTVGTTVVVGASAGDDTRMLEAPFGIAPYHELALLGGVTGASPMVTAGGVKLAPAVWYGGLLLWSFDDQWAPHTAEAAVPSPASTEIAATTVGDEAVIAWSAGGACYIARAHDAATATWWQESGACSSPKLASVGGSVALAFERDGGVYVTTELHPARAQLVAPGAHAPRLVAANGEYYLAYLAAGMANAGRFDGEVVNATPLAPATALELAVIDGAPQALAIDDAGLTSLCVE
jgi:hypothetical protein